jgi:hypothetical protein
MVRVHHRIAIVMALAVALIGAGAASAKYGRGLPTASGHTVLGAVAAHSAATNAARPVDQAGSPRGFDWGDAGIGAAGMLAVTLLVGGGVVAVTRTRRDSHQPALRPTA